MHGLGTRARNVPSLGRVRSTARRLMGGVGRSVLSGSSGLIPEQCQALANLSAVSEGHFVQ